MSGELKPYPEMQDSDVRWLGKVPAHWNVRRLRNIVEMRISNVDKHTKEGEWPIRLCNYVDVYKNDRIRLGMDFMKATATMEEVERFRLRSRDVLITKDSEAWNDIGVPALVQEVEDDVVSGYHLALLRSDARHLDGEFLFRALQSRDVAYQLHVQANGVTRYGLSHNAIKSIRLPVPPLPEQSAIARFLDHADRRIQRCIRAKEKLIALLEEQKQAIIHQAVIGRIDIHTGKPYPAYKDSSVGWLGAIPSHWDVSRLGKVIDLTVGFPFKSEGFTQSEEDTRLLRGVNVAPGQLRWDDVVRWPASDVSSYAEFRLSVGDIILGMDRPIIGSGVRVARVNEPDVPSLLLQRVARIRPIETKLTREFAMRLLSSISFSDYLAPIFTGISVPHLSPEQIRGFRVPLPSLAEQEAIGNHLDSIANRTARAVGRVRVQISGMYEFRTRLIADVVTGKLDVREAAAALPEADPLAADDPDGHVEASGDPVSGTKAEKVEELH